jgi:hypothetical protein
MIKVKASYFKAASICMSTNAERYYLNGVFIEPCAAGGVILTATDSCKLVCIHDKDGECDDPAIVGPPKGALKDSIPEGHIVVKDDGLFRHGEFISQKPVVIGGRYYPDYRKIVVEAQREGFGHGTAPAIDAKHLSCFGKVAAILKGLQNQSVPLRIIYGAKGDPALVSLGVANAFGLVMPMLADAPPEKYDWFIAGPAKPKQEKAAQEKKSRLANK